MKKLWITVLCICLCTGMCSCTENIPSQNPPSPSLSKPVVTTDENLPSKHKTTWDCVYFGSYPTTEITDHSFSAVEDYAVKDGDVIVDKELYDRLINADWTDNETSIDGEKYRRLKNNAIDTRPQHYQWIDTDNYHYFKYQPIKWRVMKVDDDKITLMADKQLDCVPYNTQAQEVFWENCTLRSFLNGYDTEQNLAGEDFSKKSQDSFYGTAFSAAEKDCILKDTVSNPNNYYFGTPCGNDTNDYVFILDEEEVFNAGKESPCSGFAASDGTNDTARRFQPTMYAMAKGAWYSPVEGNLGNGFWFLRTAGYTPSNVNYICDFGAVYNRGTYVTVNDAGILPVIRVDSQKANLQNAGTVSSDQIFKQTDDTNKQSPSSQISDNIQKYQQGNISLSEPIVVKNQFLSSGLQTTWDCLYFGSYPTAEITNHSFSAVEDYAVNDGDVIIDEDLYQRLVNAEWSDNETSLDNEKYRRIKAADSVNYSISSAQHYQWDNFETYHYFKYEPIKWRIIEINGNEAMLVSDRQLDCAVYNTTSDDVQWASCTLRSFLNGYNADNNREKIDFSQKQQDSFFYSAFSEYEQNCIINSSVDNPDNSNYKTDCGDTVQDKVFLLSSEEVFASSSAARHGFYAGSGVDDPAKRFSSTMYAKAKGTWYSPVEPYTGNGFWYMRTNGYSLSNVAYICDFGYIYNRGTDVTCNDAGILPAIRIDLSKTDIQLAGTVSSE